MITANKLTEYKLFLLVYDRTPDLLDNATIKDKITRKCSLSVEDRKPEHMIGPKTPSSANRRHAIGS